MDDFLTVLFAAILVEGLVNIVLNIKDKETDWRYWASLVLALGVSILVAYNWDLDLFSILLGEGNLPFVGAILTGVIISRGSNYMHELLKLLSETTRKIRNGN